MIEREKQNVSFHIAQQNNSKQAEAWTPVELDRMIKARLDLPAVEKLRNLGFIMAIIR